jgi:hypothetical protein
MTVEYSVLIQCVPTRTNPYRRIPTVVITRFRLLGDIEGEIVQDVSIDKESRQSINDNENTVCLFSVRTNHHKFLIHGHLL